ncbi:MAG TPA: DUF885 domain-containing protein [Lapillicoccus sp.]|nr:DUF885 domain-containing protein [Lapillicoccus sp.]
MTSREDLTALSDEFWAGHLAAQPTEAHLLGYYPTTGRYEDASRAAEDAEIARLRDVAARAEAIDPEGLDDQERTTRAVLVSAATSSADLLDARLAEVSADPIFGPQEVLPLILGMLTLPNQQVADAMPDVLAGAGQWFADIAERHREGIARGWAPAEFAVTGTIAQIERALARPLDEDPIVGALRPPEDIDVDAWRSRVSDSVEKQLRPGLATFRDVLRDEVLPLARPDDRVGLTYLEGGDDAYARTLRYFTTTDLTAQQIHDIGLAQVEALAVEYRELGAEALGTDDLQEIFDRMRDDPALHFTSGEQLVTASETAMARAWAAMPEWFEVLPQAPCAVAGTTSGAKAFYFPPASDGSRGGTFFINITDPAAWGTFELEAMAFHEGIPGHHLQLAIAGELTAIPEFRKHLHNSAFAEGWGLYSERLSDEMGLYTGPIERLGMLSADSMRAGRLVVDTGLHALGWSREQAVQFMLDNSPLSAGVVRPEIDRYAVSPGQATSYMIGRLEIQRLRREAEERQGDRFAVPAFHSAVLDSGSLPLDVLERVVKTRLP